MASVSIPPLSVTVTGSVSGLPVSLPIPYTNIPVGRLLSPGFPMLLQELSLAELLVIVDQGFALS